MMRECVVCSGKEDERKLIFIKPEGFSKGFFIHDSCGKHLKKMKTKRGRKYRGE